MNPAKRQPVLSNYEPVTNYRSFWLFYLREHARPSTRTIHIFGTSAATLCLGVALVSGEVWLVPAALILGYGPAWFAHFFVEKNRPATFRYPIWSLVSDFRMTALWFAGKLTHELEKAGVAHNP